MRKSEVNPRLNRRPRLASLGAILVLVAACASQVEVGTDAAEPTGIVDIQVYYKLAHSLTAGLQMGERWVSPKTYHSTLQSGPQTKIEAKAAGLDAQRQPVKIAPTWYADDADMISISPGEDGSVIIEIEGPGESSVRVTAGGVSNILTIKSTYYDETDASKVEVIQHSPNK